jgi:hypothetical protein
MRFLAVFLESAYSLRFTNPSYHQIRKSPPTYWRRSIKEIDASYSACNYFWDEEEVLFAPLGKGASTNPNSNNCW